ncbi:hypothetical protein AMTRI_Chr08g160480 [Amborella trichopoda]
MGKESRRKAAKFGTGKVTPVQVAFIVDKYLTDNRYTQTQLAFRSEAAALMPTTQSREVPKSLLGLADILNEYIEMKEQKIAVEQEKCRVEKLLHGMQDVISAYQFIGAVPSQASQMPHSFHSTVESQVGVASGVLTTMLTPSVPSNIPKPAIKASDANKRKASKSLSGPSTTKKACTKSPSNRSENPSSLSNQEVNGQSKFQTPPYNCPLRDGVLERETSVSRNLFSQSPLPQNESACPPTPPQPFPNHVDIANSPLETPSTINSTNPPLETSSTVNSTNPPSTTPIYNTPVGVEPDGNHGQSLNHKVEGIHNVAQSPGKLYRKSTGKRENIKSRLDFDGLVERENSAKNAVNGPSDDDTKSGEDLDMSDILDFDAVLFENDFSLSELLQDVELHELDFLGRPSHQATHFMTSSLSTSKSDPLEANLVSSGFPSTNECGVLSEINMNRQGQGALKSSNSMGTGTKIATRGRKDKRHSAGLENMPIL